MIQLNPASEPRRVHVNKLKPHLGRIPPEWADHPIQPVDAEEDEVPDREAASVGHDAESAEDTDVELADTGDVDESLQGSDENDDTERPSSQSGTRGQDYQRTQHIQRPPKRLIEII